MRNIDTVEEVYRNFKDVAILHAISRFGAKTDIPESITFLDRIKYTIDNSPAVKVSSFSIRFGEASIENRVFGVPFSQGIGIKRGRIFRHFQTDSGFREEHINNPFYRESDDIDTVVAGDGKSHNELILTHIEPCCIYFYRDLFGFSWQEVFDACNAYQLPLCELTDRGLLLKCQTPMP